MISICANYYNFCCYLFFLLTFPQDETTFSVLYSTSLSFIFIFSKFIAFSFFPHVQLSQTLFTTFFLSSHFSYISSSLETKLLSSSLLLKSGFSAFI